MVEVEARTIFRRGEAPGRPIGGRIADRPFPKELSSVASDRGYESQYSLSKALGKSPTGGVVKRWYSGEHTPIPKEFCKLIVLFQPNDENLEGLIDAYGCALIEKENQKKHFRRRR